MRFLFLLIFLAGAAMGVAYPLFESTRGGPAIGAWRAYASASGFRAVEIPLKAADAPLEVLVEMTLPASAVPDRSLSSVTVTAARNGETIFSKPVTFRDALARGDGPQASERTFSAAAGAIAVLENARYTFTVSRGEAEIPQVTAVDLVLRRGRAALDPRIRPLGLALAAIGLVGFVLAGSRRAASGGGPGAPQRGSDS